MRQDTIAREMSREIVVGAFLVMILLGLGYFTIILSGGTWFTRKLPLEVVFKDVMGLRESDSVVVRGMPVGKIKTLLLKEDGVHVILAIDPDKPVHMKKDYRITIVSTSILGGRYLQIKEGSKEHPDLPADTMFFGQQPYDLMEDAAEVVNAAKAGLTEGGIIDNVKVASEQLREVAVRMNSGQGTIGRLMSGDDTLYKDLSSTVASLKTVSERLEKGEGTLGKLLSNDDTLYKDLSSTVASLKEITGRLEKGEGTLGKLLSSDNRLYDDLSASVASFRSVAEGLEKGHGVIGRLLQDDTLYLELEETITELRATIDDFRETAPLTTFSSVLFGSL